MYSLCNPSQFLLTICFTSWRWRVNWNRVTNISASIEHCVFCEICYHFRHANLWFSFAFSGKHPVSALAEYCSKRKWQLPDYSLVFDQGPAHHKQFLFKVLVNSVEYQPAVVCGNKKQAKAQAAIYALKGLGLIPEDADISAV